MDVTLRIQRYNPDVDEAPYFVEYAVTAEPTDRVLDVLNTIKWQQDGTLTYRRSCAHGVCGSDAMRINGRNRLGCKVLVKDLIGDKRNEVTIEPIKGLPVEKDLVVDMEPFFDAYRAIKRIHSGGKLNLAGLHMHVGTFILGSMDLDVMRFIAELNA